MNEDFAEIYNMLSLDREEVKKIKTESEHDLSILLGRVRSYHINNIDISKDYNIETDFDKYKIDDICLRYNLNKDMNEYKINLLQGYLRDLIEENKFLEYRRLEEEKLSKNEYLEYVHNPMVRSDKVSSWYQDYNSK